MKSKATVYLLSAVVFGAAMFGGYALINHLAEVFGWKTPGAPVIAAEPDPNFDSLTFSDGKKAAPSAPIVENEPPAPVAESVEVAAEVENGSLPEAVEIPGEPIAAEPLVAETRVSDASLDLFSANEERAEPVVNPNILNPLADPPLAATDNDANPASNSAAGDGNGGAVTEAPPVVTPPPAPGVDEEVGLAAEVAFPVVGPVSVEVGTGDTALNTEVAVGAASVDAQISERPTAAPTIYSNALAGSVSGLIGGVGGTGGTQSSRIQVRTDNRVVIGPIGARVDANLPVVAAPIVPALSASNPAVSGAGAAGNAATNRPVLPAVSAGVLPPVAGKAQLNLPAVGINAGTSGLGIQAGQFNIRVNTGLR